MKKPSESITSASIRKVMGIFSEELKLLDQILICHHVHMKPPVNEKDMPPVYLTRHIRIDRWLLLLHPLFPHKCDRPHFLPLYIVDTGDASAIVCQFLIIYEFLFHLSINFICRTFDVTGLTICIAVGQDVTD